MRDTWYAVGCAPPRKGGVRPTEKINERMVGIVKGQRYHDDPGCDQDEVHLGGGRNATRAKCSARRDLSVAVLAILIASLMVFGWRTHEDGLNSFLDSICCGQVIAFPALETGITPYALVDEDEVPGLVRLLPLNSRDESYAYLDDWPDERRERLSTWLELGIRFEGDWQSDELALTLDVLDSFGALYGKERFAQIMQQAVRTRSRGWRNYLTVVRLSGRDLPAAAWAPAEGRILLNDGLFDDQYVAQYYHWEFAQGDRIATVGERTEIVIAHEFGHVLVDGLRLEATPGDGRYLSMEGLYARLVPADQWPHPASPTNESLVTEIGAWVLDIERTPEIAAFRASVLEQTALDEQWSYRVAEVTPVPATSR